MALHRTGYRPTCGILSSPVFSNTAAVAHRYMSEKQAKLELLPAKLAAKPESKTWCFAQSLRAAFCFIRARKRAVQLRVQHACWRYTSHSRKLGRSS
eukprot:1992612-Rhodomonas_salina.1